MPGEFGEIRAGKRGMPLLGKPLWIDRRLCAKPTAHTGKVVDDPGSHE